VFNINNDTLLYRQVQSRRPNAFLNNGKRFFRPFRPMTTLETAGVGSEFKLSNVGFRSYVGRPSFRFAPFTRPSDVDGRAGVFFEDDMILAAGAIAKAESAVFLL